MSSSPKCYSMLSSSQYMLQHTVDITVYVTAYCWYYSVWYSILLISQCTIQHTITAYCWYHSVRYSIPSQHTVDITVYDTAYRHSILLISQCTIQHTITAYCWYHSVRYSIPSQRMIQHTVDITMYDTAYHHSVFYSILLISQCTIQHTITITVYVTTYCCYHSVHYQTRVYSVSDQSEWIIPTCPCSCLLSAASCGPSLPDLSILFQLCCLAVSVETALWGPCQWRMLLNIVWGLLSVDTCL